MDLGGSFDLIRQHLLSHFWYYHRLRKLNYRVRNGNGCGLSNMVTGKERIAREGASRYERSALSGQLSEAVSVRKLIAES